tara:strand:- start:345 stop:461 length:117 start_codon:yes stop_codon:yes gene_type:complete
MFRDITIKPIAAGIACVKSSLLMGCVPNIDELFKGDFK